MGSSFYAFDFTTKSSSPSLFLCDCLATTHWASTPLSFMRLFLLLSLRYNSGVRSCASLCCVFFSFSSLSFFVCVGVSSLSLYGWSMLFMMTATCMVERGGCSKGRGERGCPLIGSARWLYFSPALPHACTHIQAPHDIFTRVSVVAMHHLPRAPPFRAVCMA